MSKAYWSIRLMQEANNKGDLMARPRITLTVSEEVYQFLSEWAEREERPLANLAAYLLSKAAKEQQEARRTTKQSDHHD
jgi:hypothetical protein